MPNPSSLVVLGCSSTKFDVQGTVPAVHLYDGPMYRILRSHLRSYRWPTNLSISVLSAKYGLIGGLAPIEHYERRMTHQRALQLKEGVAMTRGGVTSFYQQDGINAITSLTSPSGALTDTYTYDSFGNLTASSGGTTNPLRYTGREFDLETGLYYYRARYYEFSVGRFVSEDPLGFEAGVNFYLYAANSPQDLIDPTGFKQCCPKLEENKLRELLAGARDYVKDLQAGRPYVAKHGQELGRTTCLGFRAPNGRPSKEPLGAAIIKIKVDPEKEPCVYECILVHERVHQKQCETLGTKYADLTVAQIEIPAFQKEIKCYLHLLQSAGLGASRH